MESSSSTSSSSTRRTTSTEITSTSLMAIQNSFDSVYSRYAREALDELPGNFTITDPSIPGHPIIFASQGFLKMTGYDRDEVVGRGGAMFQGDRTSRRSVMEVREAVRNDRSCQVSLLNYRKDGTPFWMLFHVSPVFGRDGGRVVHFVAVQVPLEGRRLRRRRSIGCRRGSGDDGGSGDYVLGCCRKEVCNDNSLEVELVSSMDHGLDHDTRELDSDKPCEATDDEKRSAMVAMDNIFSVLTHYSESTGRLVMQGMKFWAIMMATTKTLSIFLVLATTYLAAARAAQFDIINKCSYTVWAAAVPTGGGRQLNSGQTWTIQVAARTTAARIWARTGCSFDGSGNGHCNTGDCGGRLQCSGYGQPPNTLAEFALNQYNNLDFYDISLVDGFNVPMQFSPTSNGCTRSISCTADIIGQCPSQLKTNGGCNNPCTVFKTDQYCCNSGSCSATDYSRYFKTRCPDAYSYPKDDQTSTFTCPGGTNYKVVFCP